MQFGVWNVFLSHKIFELTILLPYYVWVHTTYNYNCQCMSNKEELLFTINQQPSPGHVISMSLCMRYEYQLYRNFQYSKINHNYNSICIMLFIYNLFKFSY